MIKQSLKTIFLILLSTSCFAIEVKAPQELQTSEFEISDPDRFISTLGKVDFIVDLSASHDDLLALKVRRSDLKLKDGRAFNSFGVHKDAGIIIIAGEDVSHISIASINGNDASVLFYGKNNEVIAPKPNDIAIFDSDLKPLDFNYTPLQTPGSLTIPITIALDTSGSMSGHMDEVVKATKDFMSKLPDFTRCQLITFNEDVNYLSARDIKKQVSCPASTYLLNQNLQVGGMTALYKAIQTSFHTPFNFIKGRFPNIAIVVTDGKNTVDFKYGLLALSVIKKTNDSKLFVFWAGNYDKDNLSGLPDLEFISTQNLQSDLDKFFRTLGVSLSGIQVLKITR